MNIFDAIAGRKPNAQMPWARGLPTGAPGATQPIGGTPPVSAAPASVTMGAAPLGHTKSEGFADAYFGKSAIPGQPETFGDWAGAQVSEDARAARSFLANADIKAPSIWDKIGGALDDPMMRGALLRSGAATINGGLGAGIAAGANWYDQTQQRKAADARAESQWADQMRLKDIGIKQEDQRIGIDRDRADADTLFKAAQMENMAMQNGIDIAELNEVIRKNKEGEKLTAREQEIDAFYKGQNIQLGYAGLKVNEANNIRNNDTTRRGQDVTVYTHDTVGADTVYTQDSIDRRTYNPPVTAGDGTTTETTVGPDGKKTTKTTTKATFPVIRTQEAYDALAPGTWYRDSDGVLVPKAR